MGNPTNIDPRIAEYAYKKFDPSDPKCQTDLANLASQFKNDAALKPLFQQIAANEDLIDYREDNHSNPKMNGLSSTVEWAAFAWAAAQYAKTHPEIALTLKNNGQGPQLEPQALKAIIEAGRTIHTGYSEAKYKDALLHAPQVERIRER